MMLCQTVYLSKFVEHELEQECEFSRDSNTVHTQIFIVFRLLLCPHFLLYLIMATNLITFRKKTFLT